MIEPQIEPCPDCGSTMHRTCSLTTLTRMERELIGTLKRDCRGVSEFERAKFNKWFNEQASQGDPARIPNPMWAAWQGRAELTAAATKELKSAWLAWLEQHGVPISKEFVRLANALGALEVYMFKNRPIPEPIYEYGGHKIGELIVDESLVVEATPATTKEPLPTLEAWLHSVYGAGVDLDRLEIPARVVMQIAKSYAESQLSSLVGERDQLKHQLDVSCEAVKAGIAQVLELTASRAEIAGECYQLAGAVGAPARVLDALSGTAKGDLFVSFLPVSPDECAEISELLETVERLTRELKEAKG